MNTNNENWHYNHETPNSTRILGTVNEVYDNVAIETGDEDENADLLENHRTPTVAMATTANNGNASSTSINIEFLDGSAVINNNRNPARNQSRGPFLGRQFVMLWNDARTRLASGNPNGAVIPEIVPQQQHAIVRVEQENAEIEENANINRVQSAADWRLNLNNIFSMLTLPNAFNLRIINSNLPNDILPTLPHQRANIVNVDHSTLNERVNSIQRRSSLIENSTNNNNINNDHNHNGNDANASPSTQAAGEDDFGNRENTNNANEDPQMSSQVLLKLLTHIVRYVPFVCIVLLKFIHDSIFSLIDIAVHQFIVFKMNESLCLQISKLGQKNYYILVRDFLLISTVVFLRFYLASGAVDPFGLLVTPTNMYMLILKTNDNSQKLTEKLTTNADSLELTMTISLSIILYYVIINDLILKLLTILIKIVITMLPNKILLSKPRSRLFVAVEYSSQFYRAVAPMKEWIIYFVSYNGMEKISGLIFTSFYLIVKLFELMERGKSLKKAISTLIRNQDHDRQPNERELSAVDVCPICYDTFTSPVVIECGHIFCDNCINIWLKKYPTCPLCRAKVREDIDFQDGSTTSLYQIF